MSLSASLLSPIGSPISYMTEVLRLMEEWKNMPTQKLAQPVQSSNLTKLSSSGISKKHLQQRAAPSKMTPKQLRQQQRQHNILLLAKTLNSRESSSPFTLILDDAQQTGHHVLAEFILRKSVFSRKRDPNRALVIFLAFETVRRPVDVDHLIMAANNMDIVSIQSEISHIIEGHPRSLICIDSLHDLTIRQNFNATAFLSSFIRSGATIAGVYHQDIPAAAAMHQAHEPSPFRLFTYIATTIITVRALKQVYFKKLARERAVGEPCYGLDEEVDGILQGLHGNSRHGYVMETEFRRRSGRSVTETFFMRRITHGDFRLLKKRSKCGGGGGASREAAILLEDHPLWSTRYEEAVSKEPTGDMMSTFNLELTGKQRMARESVVLPYYDAQKGEGGEGGRILYDMGMEDDFDEEEDEI